MPNSIYLDNASTTFPKPPEVAEAVFRFMTECGVNINRGTYSPAYDTEEMIFETREMLCQLFNYSDPKNVIFTQNITMSLNFAIKGLLKPGDHVLVSSMEHNAVMRPLTQLEKSGVTFSRIPCSSEGVLDMSVAEKLLRPETAAVIMTHASNVCGTIMPLEEVGHFCKKHNLVFIADTAQTAGVFPVDMEKMNIDILCFTGHKGLLAPQGTGGMIIRDEIVSRIDPLIIGGTGSISHTEEIPEFMPDRFESGTMNLPGIAGLHASLSYLEKHGTDSIRNHELELTEIFLNEIRNTDKIRIAGKKDISGRTGVVSLQIEGMDSSEVAFRLEEEFGILTRVGLHCAPSAHKTLETYPEGTVRFSFGLFNTEDDVRAAASALAEIAASS